MAIYSKVQSSSRAVGADHSVLIRFVIDAFIFASSIWFTFSISNSVSTYYIVLIVMAVLATKYVVGGYRPSLTCLGVSKTVATSVVVSLVSGLVIYVLLSGTDKNRMMFLLCIWMPCLVISHYISDKITASFALRIYKPRYLFVNINERMKVMLVDALQQQPGYQSDSVVEMNFSEDDKQSRIDDCYAGYTIVYGSDSLSSTICSKFLLRNKLSGNDVVRDDSQLALLTGRLYAGAEERAGFYGNLVLESRNGFHNRLLDVIGDIINRLVGIVLAVVLLAPIMCIALFVKVLSPGPVFFVQERLGKNGVPFKLVKFRTMEIDAEKGGPQWAAANDSRVTSVGAVLRELHLDELPQVWNLLKGDLNLVGPRPMRKHFVNVMRVKISNFDLRFLVKPGITGWAQTLGPYGVDTEEQSVKFEYDLYYILNRHLISDATIVGLTITKVFASGIKILLRSTNIQNA